MSAVRRPRATRANESRASIATRSDASSTCGASTDSSSVRSRATTIDGRDVRRRRRAKSDAICSTPCARRDARRATTRERRDANARRTPGRRDGGAAGRRRTGTRVVGADAHDRGVLPGKTDARAARASATVLRRAGRPVPVRDVQGGSCEPTSTRTRRGANRARRSRGGCASDTTS